MPFTYSHAAKLNQTEKVGSHRRVALVQTYAGLAHTSAWKPGKAVMGNDDIVPGTAIATFVRGRYLSAAHGNHAAFFLRYGMNGFWIVDQWADKPNKPVRAVSERLIASLRMKQGKNGAWPRASDNADAYSIIEIR